MSVDTLAGLAERAPYGELPLAPGVEVVDVPVPQLGSLSGLRAIPDAPDVPDAPVSGIAVLLPGYTGSKEDLRLLLPELRAHGWACLALSRRGQADSDGPEDAAAYSLEREAADAVEVARMLGAPIHLVGHSLGGVIARAAAIAAPDAFASVTLLCSGPRGWRHRKLRERVVAAEEGNRALWDATNPRWIGVDPAQMDAGTRFVFQRMLDTRTGSIVGGAEVLESEDDTTDAFRETGLPLLVARGATDEHWPSPWQEEMARRLRAPYVVIEGADHSPALENPQETARMLADFWARTH